MSPQGILQKASLQEKHRAGTEWCSLAGIISQLGGPHHVGPCHSTQDHVTQRRSVPRGLPLTPIVTSGAPGEPAGLEWAAHVLLGIPSQHSCTERRGCGCCLQCLQSRTWFDTMCFDLCAPESASPSPPACWDHVRCLCLLLPGSFVFSLLLLGSAVSSLPEQTICATRTSVTAFLCKTLPSLQCPHPVEEPGGAEVRVAAHGQLGTAQPPHPAAPAGTRAWQSWVTSWDGCGSMEQVVTRDTALHGPAANSGS